MDRRAFLGLMATTAAAAMPTTPLPITPLEHADCQRFKHFFEQQRHDVVADAQMLRRITALADKLSRIRKVVGYGNFNLIGFDEMLKVSQRYASVGALTPEELELFESLFYRNASAYGFYGDKVFTSMTDVVARRDTVKVAGSGHYLYKGAASETYERIQKEIGNVVLTSGVRSVVKQMDLFLHKVVRSRGNLSVASRSLAPAGYSFHGVGDFDVGKVGFGYRNFTAAFAHTEEFRRLMDSGYIQIRYPKGNPYGVRFEPWHIKVV